jgi:hypothetical protein
MYKVFLGTTLIASGLCYYLYQENQKLLGNVKSFELEMNRYLDIFKRHNLSKLAAAKPGLIQTRVNNATKEVFDGIEQDSRDIDDADDGLILQPTPEADIRG